MKRIIIFTISILIIYGTSIAQTNTAYKDTTVYLTAAQEAFMIDKETNYLLKTRPFSFEQKLSPGFSIEFGMSPHLQLVRRVTAESSSIELAGINVDFSIEPRYYYKLPKLIKKGKQANNLSSTYIGAFGSISTNVYDNSTIGLTSQGFKEIGISFGNQRRFLNYGFVDYGLTLSYFSADINPDLFGASTRSGVSLKTRTRVGFALGKRYKITDEVKCPIFKCQQDRKSAFKVNLNRNSGIFYLDEIFNPSEKIFQISLAPSFSYEHKLFNSSFSLNQDVGLSISAQNKAGVDSDQFKITHFSANYRPSIRYYFMMKNRIRKGKSGNNLSGFYGFMTGRLSYVNSETKRYIFVPEKEVQYVEYLSTTLYGELGVGYQKTVLSDLFLDIELGISRKLKNYKGNDDELDPFYLKFKVGKIF